MFPETRNAPYSRRPAGDFDRRMLMWEGIQVTTSFRSQTVIVRSVPVVCDGDGFPRGVPAAVQQWPGLVAIGTLPNKVTWGPLLFSGISMVSNYNKYNKHNVIIFPVKYSQPPQMWWEHTSSLIEGEVLIVITKPGTQKTLYWAGLWRRRRWPRRQRSPHVREGLASLPRRRDPLPFAAKLTRNKSVDRPSFAEKLSVSELNGENGGSTVRVHSSLMSRRRRLEASLAFPPIPSHAAHASSRVPLNPPPEF